MQTTTPETPDLFEVVIGPSREIQVRHRGEGHLYTFKVVTVPDRKRILSAPVIVSGHPAHSPLAFRHAAHLRAVKAALDSQMIDEEHSVVSLGKREIRPAP